MRQQPVAQLWLEPRRFRRHDGAGVGNPHQVVNRDGKQRERHRKLSRIDKLLELARTANAANKINPLVGSHVGDAQKRRQYMGLQKINVESIESRWHGNRVPLAFEVHGNGALTGWQWRAALAYQEASLEAFEKPNRRHP